MAGRPKKINKVEEEIKKETKIENVKETKEQLEENKKEEEKVTNTEYTKPSKKIIPLDTMVACRNATKGKLVYVSKKIIGYEIEWEKFGSVEWLELSELISMKNVYSRFFKDGWLIIEDPEIIRYLGLEKYYENIIDIDNFDNIFTKSDENLQDTLIKMPNGLKESVIERARELIKEGKLDSMKKIEIIQKVFNVDLKLMDN